MKEYYESKLKEYSKLYSQKTKKYEELKIVFYCSLITIIILVVIIINLIK